MNQESQHGTNCLPARQGSFQPLQINFKRMKKLLLLVVLLFGGFLHVSINAQVSLSVNIGVQPLWGPVGYDHAEYYYMPDIEAYYYVPKHRFVYLEGDRWVTRTALPPRYKDYDLYKIHKVVINEPQPYLRHHEYREKYVSYKGRHEQEVIRNSHESRYWENKEHPEHAKWKEEHRHRGRERGHSDDHQDRHDNDRNDDHQDNDHHR